MAVRHGEGIYGNAVGVTTPVEHRLGQAGSVTKSATTALRPGIFWGGNASLVTGTATMSYNVAAFHAVSSRSATDGAVFFANDAVVNVATAAAPGSNSRIDSVYAWHRDFALDGSNSDPVIGVAQGTAAASPTAPSLAAFPGAIELARITVPAGVTATNTGTTFAQTAPFTANAGGIVPVRNSTERDAGTWVASQIVYRIDTDTFEARSSGTWTTAFSSTTTGTATAGASFTFNGNNKLTKRGGLITYNIAGVYSANPSNGSTVATLPTGFRPASGTIAYGSGAAVVGVAFNPVTFRIDGTTGSVQIYNVPAGTVADVVGFAVYPDA